MCAYNDSEIEYLSATPPNKARERLGPRMLATAAGTNASFSAKHRSDDASAVAPHGGRGPASLRAVRSSTVFWALLRNAAKQPLARLDQIAAKLNMALVIIAAGLAYVDLVVYLGFKAVALNLDWARILQIYAIAPSGTV